MFPYSEIGILGSLLLAGAFIPQCYRLLNTKSAKDISFFYPFVLSVGSFCLTVYGYGIRDAIVFTLNLYATFCNVELVLLKIYYDRKAKLQLTGNGDKKEKMPAQGGR
jgi:MtN3 and saliva related transmembrane protein